jgi:ribose 5-phosphate isomerase A
MNEKLLAAEASIEYLEYGMIVGLGSGSTVALMLNKLSQRIKEGLSITAVSTSSATSKLAKSLGIKVSSISDVDEIDITIDGADEVDENLNGIKGGGGALLQEKIIASVSKTNIWIVDSTKLVKTLGNFPLPVEVVQFGSNHLFKKFEEQGYNPSFRIKEKMRYLTDNNNYIIDLRLGKIEDPAELDVRLKSFPGVVETGLFYGIADVVIAGVGGSVKVIDKKKRVHH